MPKRKKSKTPTTKTPQEIMADEDAKHMLSLLRDLFTYMPATFRDAFKRRGFLQFRVRDCGVLITSGDRFEQSSGKYGKAAW